MSVKKGWCKKTYGDQSFFCKRKTTFPSSTRRPMGVISFFVNGERMCVAQKVDIKPISRKGKEDQKKTSLNSVQPISASNSV